VQKVHLILAKLGFGLYLLWRASVYYFRRYFRFLLISFLVFLFSLTIFVCFPPASDNNFNDLPQKVVFIPRGASLMEIAHILKENELLEYEELFVLLGKISGYQHQLKAGMFKVPQNLHPWHLLQYLTHPVSADIKITLPEGIPATEIAGILQRRLGIDSTRFMNLVQDSSFCRSLGVDVSNLEGYLLPETYYLPYGMPEEKIIRLLVSNTLKIFESDSIRQQLERIGMTRHQILTMASIIEGEVVVDSERVLVSSVYHNRLKRGWRLQADPTIQYIIPGPPRRLLLKDLEIDSPYNTYRYRGLPPGPINNPGKKSILAAIFPAKTRYMYFVATGDGGHHFSRTAAEHSRWKARFDKIRRSVRRKNRQ